MDDEGEGGFDLDALLSPQRDRRVRRLPGLLGGALRLVWSAAPRLLAVSVALQLLASVGIAAQLLIGRRILSQLLAGGGHSTDLGRLTPSIILLAAATAVVSFANLARNELQRPLAERVARRAASQVIDVSTAVDLMAWETPSFHDRLRRALVNAQSRPLQMAIGVVGLAGSLISIAGIGGALLVIQPLFVLLVVLAYIPVWLATVRASRAVYRWDAAWTERERRRSYLEAVLTRKEEAKELRAFGAAALLRDRYDRLYDARLAEMMQVVTRRLRLGAAGSLGTSALTGAALAFLLWLVSSHRLSLAGAGAAAAAVVLLGSQLQGLASSAGQLYESSLFIEDFTSFVAWAPRLADAAAVPRPAAAGPFRRLEADSVRFTYPSRSRPSLHDVSIDVAAGEIVALVGDNGSGKTTLAKILAGLLDPQEGAVRWDGVDTRTLAPESMRTHVTVVFQDFVRYALSLADNIELGRPSAAGDDAALDRALQQAGLVDLAARLPEGLRTPLGPEFLGGVDLSGGQWQRVALARAFFRDAPFVILDEPTAALDPRSEAALFDRVRALFAGRAVLLVSHRFSSVRSANRIYVLHEGRVLEHGTHSELMAAGGSYAEMYTLQAASLLEEPTGSRPPT